MSLSHFSVRYELIKREQSEARFDFAEREESQRSEVGSEMGS